MTLLRNVLLTTALLASAPALAQTDTTAAPATTGATTAPTTSGALNTATGSGTTTNDRSFDYGWLGLLGLLGLAGFRRQTPAAVVPERSSPAGPQRP